MMSVCTNLMASFSMAWLRHGAHMTICTINETKVRGAVMQKFNINWYTESEHQPIWS